MQGEYVEIKDITFPKQGYKAMIGRWWLTRNGNPLVYVDKVGTYPQCNYQESMIDYWVQHKELENLGKVFIPLAFVPIDKE